MNGLELHARATTGATKRFVTDWERPVIDFYTSKLSPGDTVYDVGAAEGLYSLIASKVVGDDGTVVAVESSTGRARLVKINARKNNCRNIRIENTAAGAEHGTMEMNENTRTGAMRVDKTSGRTAEVTVVPLDALSPPPDFVKLDVEGGEYGALKGISGHLAESAPEIICEVHPQLLRSIGDSVADITALLDEHGYETHAITDEGLKKTDIQSDQRGHYYLHTEQVSN